MNCGCPPPCCNHDEPLPPIPPDPLPPCEEGEPCDEVTDAGCVVYTDEPLPAVNVAPNDRLNDIIRKWAQNVASGTQAIHTEETLTTRPEGNGTAVMPLLVHVKRSDHPDNLLRFVDYQDSQGVQQTGLEVRITDQMIAWILSRISADITLRQQFCDLVGSCEDFSCGLITNLRVSISA